MPKRYRNETWGQRARILGLQSPDEWRPIPALPKQRYSRETSWPWIRPFQVALMLRVRLPWLQSRVCWPLTHQIDLSGPVSAPLGAIPTCCLDTDTQVLITGENGTIDGQLRPGL